jgi:thiol-disulfide isomerase/thioredoxin
MESASKRSSGQLGWVEYGCLMMLVVFVILFVVFIFNRPSCDSASAVRFKAGTMHTLKSDDQAKQFLKSGGMLLVYMNGCGPCHHFKPILEQAAGKSDVPFAAIELSNAQNFVRENQVSGFPTVFYTTPKNNDKYTKYTGGRTVEDVMKHVSSIRAEFQ